MRKIDLKWRFARIIRLTIMSFVPIMLMAVNLSARAGVEQPGIDFRVNPVFWLSLKKYAGREVADFLYKGPLSKQLGSVFEAPGDPPSIKVRSDRFLATGFRSQDATNRGAAIVDKAAHIYLAAIATSATDWHGKRLGGQPKLRILVRDPKNLRYLPVVEKWADSQDDMRGYQLSLYNLNCKARDIEQCKMPVPAAGAALAAR